MRLRREHLDEIVAHSREDDPNESCGIVAGRDGGATRVFRARNEFANPTSFMLHPQDQIRIYNEIDEAGEEIAAIYHSHTRSEAYPSLTDVNLARDWPDPLWMICSLAGAEPVVRAFRIRDGSIEEVELVVEAG